MAFQGFFAAFVKTANHKAPVDREVCLSSRAWIGKIIELKQESTVLNKFTCNRKSPW